MTRKLVNKLRSLFKKQPAKWKNPGVMSDKLYNYLVKQQIRENLAFIKATSKLNGEDKK